MTIPALTVFILVLGLALAKFFPKSAGVALALHSAVYVVIVLAAAVALGHLRVSLFVFGSEASLPSSNTRLRSCYLFAQGI
ncbi:hypothetical protein K466DRAFT_585215 [Polyporus arcularius HHB13444]|uniref:NADH:quinone oxidoreductase/Mrp antiporter membrane subunit domain-containing protein n=1 Tax=Polyporus arcularius HHB13444 TaxID=1314778 RepID=A0A5C3PHN2_9APHY|nr:hypothetical protein K466DRAFT_585215 [Polyporus arcularius HHB13444]